MNAEISQTTYKQLVISENIKARMLDSYAAQVCFLRSASLIQQDTLTQRKFVSAEAQACYTNKPRPL